MNNPLLTKTLIGILLLISNVFSNKLFAQTQGTGIFFQAVARDNFSNPAKDRKIYIQSTIIQSTENYVWPSAKGTMKGQSIIPLYPSVVEAVQKDYKLYELLALIDALRVGKAREREIAISELKERILNGK